MNGEVGRLRGELERARLGSVINHPSDVLNSTLNQLQSALAVEKDNVKSVTKEKESCEKENMDLKRQVIFFRQTNSRFLNKNYYFCLFFFFVR